MPTTKLTSRQFNQDTGGAKKAAEKGPVYITDRGRPSHVLLTFADFQRLSASLPGIIDRLARQIDTRAFNPAFPAYFPRFIENAIWRFCAGIEHDICNGNMIYDTDRCALDDCPAYLACGRVALRPEAA